MELNEYQRKAKETAIFPDLIIRPSTDTSFCETDAEDAAVLKSRIENAPSLSWVYPAIGLAGEAGETLEKLKKILRDSEGYISPETTEQIKKELGDVLWYFATLCSELGLSLDEVAEGNIEKLSRRLQQGTLQGSGDDR